MFFLGKIRKKGIVESIVFSTWMVLAKAIACVRVAGFRIRGYDISLSVYLGKDVFLFQSMTQAITIDRGSHIGSGVRIKAGFNGKISIGKNVLVDDYSYISAQNSISIGDETMIASNVYIVDFNHIYPLQKSKKHIGFKQGYNTNSVKIGKYVWIGTHAVILPGVTIGDGAVIGAGTVVTKSVPAYSIAVGNPARVVKKIK
ncbi:MAG TPA: acyltransferase [Patescibacteria group bacterium]|nr:acyltransferase [Patescibacteria group bacterium]